MPSFSCAFCSNAVGVLLILLQCLVPEVSSLVPNVKPSFLKASHGLGELSATTSWTGKTKTSTSSVRRSRVADAAEDGGGLGDSVSQTKPSVGELLMLTSKDIAALRKKYPPLNNEEILRRRLQCLTGVQDSAIGVLLEHVGMDGEMVKSAVLKHPLLLSMKPRCVSERVMWLKNNLGLSEEQLCKVILRRPRVLDLSVEINMVPVSRWLQKELGATREVIGAMVCRYPEILGLSPHRNLSPKVKWFEKELGMSREGVSNMTSIQPALLGYSIESNLEPKVRWLQEHLRASRAEVLLMLSKWPGVLTCSVDRNLSPTLQFYADELGAEPEELRRTALSSPRLLGASIERRMRPRVAAMAKRGIVATFADHKWKLVLATNQKFEDWMEEQWSPVVRERSGIG
ncbi:unnamed protein product, partial [Discosporangium mesarthrocarpum]